MNGLGVTAERAVVLSGRNSWAFALRFEPQPWTNPRSARPSWRTARLGKLPPDGAGSAPRIHVPVAWTYTAAPRTKQGPANAAPTTRKRPSGSLANALGKKGPSPVPPAPATTGPHVLVAGSKIWLAVLRSAFTVVEPTTSTCPFPSRPLT